MTQPGPAPRLLLCLGLAALGGRWLAQTVAPASPLLTGPLLISALLLQGQPQTRSLTRVGASYLAALAWPLLLQGVGQGQRSGEVLLVAGLLAVHTRQLGHLPALAAGFLAWSAGPAPLASLALGVLLQTLPLCLWLLASRAQANVVQPAITQ